MTRLSTGVGLQNGRAFAAGLHTSSKLQQDLVEVFIDDKPVQVPPGTTVLQVTQFPLRHLLIISKDT